MSEGLIPRERALDGLIELAAPAFRGRDYEVVYDAGVADSMEVIESLPVTNETELLELLDLADSAATWANQMQEHFRDKPGGQHFAPEYTAYRLARVRYFATRRPLNSYDYGGCTGCSHHLRADGTGCYDWTINDDCSYHLAAALQPWNHRIPWACGDYWDGCNCEGGPFYDAPEGTF